MECGNTLAGTIFGVWMTQRSLIWGGSLHQLSGVELEQYKNRKHEQIEPALSPPEPRESQPPKKQEKVRKPEETTSSIMNIEAQVVNQVFEELGDLPLFNHALENQTDK